VKPDAAAQIELNLEPRNTADALAEKLDAKLREWRPETAAQVRQRVAEVIDLADHDVLDLMRSRAAEQEVLDLLDEPTSR
jgi:hypothetical protein